MIQLAYVLSIASGVICSGMIEHVVILTFICLIAWGAAKEWDGRIQKTAISFWLIFVGTMSVFPLACSSEKLASALYGHEEVQKEFVRLKGSESYMRGRNNAEEAYTETKQSVVKWSEMRASGLCVQTSKDFERVSYRLVCADGWTGSRCGCDGGRGCCSWHGGYGYCETRTTIETVTRIDGMTYEDPGGLTRFDECGGDTIKLRRKYRLTHAINTQNSRPNFEWKVGWDDVAGKYTDFERVVMKNKTIPFNEEIEQ